MKKLKNWFKLNTPSGSTNLPMWLNGLALVTLIFSIGYLMTPPPITSFADLEIGEKVWQDIKSNYDFTVVDEPTTERRRNLAENAVLPVYDFESNLAVKLAQRLSKSFNLERQKLREERIREGLSETLVGPPEPGESSDLEPQIENTPDENELFNDFVAESGIRISFEIFRMLRNLGFQGEVEQGAVYILNRVCQYAIVGNRNLLIEQSPNGLTLIDLSTSLEKNFYNLDLVISVEDAYREIEVLASRRFPDNQILQDVTAEIAVSLIRPNLTPNMQETQNRKKKAREAVKPVFFKVASGEIIARENDRVTPEIKIRLDYLNRLGHENRFGIIFLGNLALLLLILIVVWTNINRFYSSLLKDRNRLFLIGLISFLQSVLIFLFSKLAALIPGLMDKYPFNISEPYLYGAPFAVGTMLLALLVNTRIAIFFSFVFGALAATALEGDFFIGLYAMFSSVAAVFAVTQYKQRTMVIQAGFLISLANLILVITLHGIKGDIASLTLALAGLNAVISGLLVAAIVTVLLPGLEWLFHIPTDIRLLELSNFNQPLLRKLALEAPGTHHHSLLVGDLAEIAAEAIGANALLVRVGAYYHDIGKISKPHYFIENLRGKNPHDELTPSMSAMVIRKHVKEGVELAKKSGLGKDIIDIIEQHHGNSLLTFFYEKAKEIHGKANANGIDKEFRYPGPRPQSKEAAIVLLADSVEAAARSLKTPSASALKGLVTRLTQSKFQDRQFDDCDLTFRELTIIAEKLYQRLLRNYHSRIEYPGFNFDNSDKTNELNKSKETGME